MDRMTMTAAVLFLTAAVTLANVHAAAAQTNTEKLNDISRDTDDILAKLAETAALLQPLNLMAELHAAVTNLAQTVHAQTERIYERVDQSHVLIQGVISRLDGQDMDRAAMLDAITDMLDDVQDEIIDEVTDEIRDKNADGSGHAAQLTEISYRLAAIEARLAAIEQQPQVITVTTPAPNVTAYTPMPAATAAPIMPGMPGMPGANPAPQPLPNNQLVKGKTVWTVTRADALAGERSVESPQNIELEYRTLQKSIKCDTDVWLQSAAVRLATDCNLCDQMHQNREAVTESLLGKELWSTRFDVGGGNYYNLNAPVEYNNRILHAGQSVTYTAKLLHAGSINAMQPGLNMSLKMFDVTIEWLTGYDGTRCSFGPLTAPAIPGDAPYRSILNVTTMTGHGLQKDYTTTMSCDAPYRISDVTTSGMDSNYPGFNTMRVASGPYIGTGNMTAGALPPDMPTVLTAPTTISGQVIADNLLIQLGYYAAHATECKLQ